MGDLGLRVETRGTALALTLDRPHRRNALTVELVAALADRIEQAGRDDATRAIIVAGGPPVFCSGGDLDDLATVADRGALAVSDVIYRQFHRLVRAITTAPVPVIAQVHGAALGAGLDLTLVCDLRYAAVEATFASSWVNVGLVPGMGGAQMLTRLVGGTRAAELLLLGQPMTAAEAVRIGLVNDAVPAEDLTSKVDEVVAALTKLSSAALARNKAALRRAVDAGLEAELATLGATQGALLTGPDFQRLASRFRRSAAD